MHSVAVFNPEAFHVAAASHSQKGPSRKDNRDLVTYDDDDLF